MNDKITTKWIRDTFGKVKKNYSVKETNNDISVSVSSVTTKPVKFNHSLKVLPETQDLQSPLTPSPLPTSFTINYHSLSHSNCPEVLPLSHKIVIEKPVEKKKEEEKKEEVATEVTIVDVKEEEKGNEQLNSKPTITIVSDVSAQEPAGSTLIQVKQEMEVVANEVADTPKPVEQQPEKQEPVSVKQEKIESIDTPAEPVPVVAVAETNETKSKPASSKKMNHKSNEMEEEGDDDDDDEVIIEEEENEEEEECNNWFIE